MSFFDAIQLVSYQNILTPINMCIMVKYTLHLLFFKGRLVKGIKDK